MKIYETGSREIHVVTHYFTIFSYLN